ncbi:MAG: NAD(P)-dependent glycerol-3-phosphate dehydrogenase [Limnobacter sp.]|uniref:NAD(P)H-dependent glycerol-3-phosphate dehydrogenase n=1 Tax=Limnobacter sp. TaxID=2003368 RepID=UPI0022C185C3|nr:NAD(P)H-dependent glycerol-3-phosphate dehydrogenase [Limnobacter sp.]MCZ8016450.1 NAD(P)-dependent glycerol-3-phosphate dehydrogenase [Limnobacter sp.]
MHITVFGAGAWGTAVAAHMSFAHETVLWGRDPTVLVSIASQRENPRYLAGIKLNPSLKVQADFALAAKQSLGQPDSLWVLGTPMGALRQTLEQLQQIAPVEQWPPLVWLCKGFEVGTGLMPHQVVEDVLCKPYGGALTGPSFAAEVARGLPCALTAASADEPTRQAMVRAAHHAALRVYELDDLVGAEVGGAVKNIMAVATGICDGMQLGLNARAALITRGMAEIKRLAVALGAQAETLNGLSGFGDLILTCTGDLSRNRRVGLMLAQGKSLDTILKELGQVAEGVKCAPVVKELAGKLGVDMPITAAVNAVLFDGLSPGEGVMRLLSRGARSEDAD